MTFIILVDQDGVQAEWGADFDAKLAEAYPLLDFPHLKNGNINWDMAAGATAEMEEAINATMQKPGFYRDLKPIPGAVEALREMQYDKNTQVFMCTAPTIYNPTCASDKLAWFEEHLGESWAKRAIITSDKTLVRGHILIDDKPVITGAVTPTWEHVLFDQPYNRGIVDTRLRIHNWTDDSWRDVIAEAKERYYERKAA